MKNSILLSSAIALLLNMPVQAANPMSKAMDMASDGAYSLFDMVTGLPKTVGKMVEEDEDGPSSLVAFTIKTRAMIAAGDAAKGKDIAANNKCNKCHSENGIAEDSDDPNLAGQTASYIYKQLMDYKSEHRDEKSMRKAVRKLGEADFVNLAAWYESLPAAPSMFQETEVALKLVYNGDPKRMLKPCGTCHGRNGEGSQHEHARLTGLSIGSFTAAMEEFKEGDRTNDIYSRMRLISEQLTEDEIEALANYYSAEPPADDEEDED